MNCVVFWKIWMDVFLMEEAYDVILILLCIFI